MKISEIIRENVTPRNPTIGDISVVKTNFPDADFWIIRKGSEDKVGMPTKEYSPENIGVKITNNSFIPDYIRIMVEYHQMRGYYKRLARGTLRLVNISIQDVKDTPLILPKTKKPVDYRYKDVGYKMGEPRFKTQ